jgi:uncharacterized protein (UPF0276 family)
VTPRTTPASEVLVELRRSVNVKFDVQKLLDEFPEDWAEWQKLNGEDYDTPEDCLRDYVEETVAKMGWDLLDFNDWVIPEPMYDDEETEVRWKS